MTDLPPFRSAFSDVDASEAGNQLIEYLDAARRAPAIVGAKSWSFDAVHVGRHQQPAMGRRLRGLLTTHGFTDIELGAGVVMYTDVSSACRAFGMAPAGDLAVRAGVISEQEALRWSEDLVKADDDLTFFASVTGFRASGRLPTASPQ